MSNYVIRTVGDYRIVTMKSGRWRQNGYIVHHIPSGGLLLVDPGGHEDALFDAIENEGAELQLVILTHGHYDHVGGVSPVCQRYGLPFHMHTGDRRLLIRAPLYAVSFEKRNIEVSSNHRFLGAEPLVWSGEPIQYLSTPGHTPGSVCYFWNQIAFTGDTLLCQQMVTEKLPGGDAELLAESVGLLLQALPEDTLLFPGHGKPWFVKEAREWWVEHASDPPGYIEEELDA